MTEYGEPDDAGDTNVPDQFFTLDGRPIVRAERSYPHPIDTEWRAVTTAEHLEHWFQSTVEIDLREGGTMRFGAFGDDAGQTGTIESVQPPRLRPSHGAQTRRPSKELVHEFGLDQPAVTETDTGWTVRIERQLTCPTAVAWDLWFGKDRDPGQQRKAPAVGEVLAPDVAPDMAIGTMTEVDLHHPFAFDIAPSGGLGNHVRLEFADGAGHGVKVTFTVTGTDPAERDAAVQMWAGGAIGHLAASSAEWAMAQPVDA